MRTLLLGLLGGLVGAALVAAVVVGVSVARASRADAPAARRATLLRQIDEYEQWTKDTPTYRTSMCAGTQSIGYQDCLAARQRFLVPRPELARYAAWWQDERLREARAAGGRSGIGDFILDSMPPDSLRDPKYLERYLAGR